MINRIVFDLWLIYLYLFVSIIKKLIKTKTMKNLRQLTGARMLADAHHIVQFNELEENVKGKGDDI